MKCKFCDTILDDSNVSFRNNLCKSCHNKRIAKYRSLHPDRIKLSKQKERIKNKERYSKYNTQHYIDNKEQYTLKNRERYLKNREARLLYRKQYLKDKSEQVAKH